MSKFNDVRAGDWVRWYDASSAGYDARVESVDADKINLGFGRAPIYRAEFERMGVTICKPVK